MNQQALNDAYKLFTNAGYNKSIDEFQILLSENPKALADSYALFTKAGYTGNEDSYKELLGLKKKDPSEVSTSPTEGGESVSGGTEALDQSLQDRLDQGHVDLSTFTTGTDQEAKDAVMEAERARVYQEFGIDYAQRQSLLDQKSQIELEKEKAREELTDAKMQRLGIKQKEGSDQYYIPTDKGLFSGNFLQNLDQAFTGYDYDDESEFRLGSREEAEEYAIKNYEKSDSVVDTEIEDLERKTKPLSNLDEGDVYKALEEQEEDAIKAEEYLNTRMMNSFIDQGFSGDRLNQLIEESGVNTAYVKSKAFMINGEETSPANIEQQIYDRDFINGLQNGSIKVSIDPAVAETDYGKFLQTTLDVQSNAGSEISDIAQEFLAGGVSMGAGMLEVAEVVEGPFSEEYMKTGGVVANHIQDYAEQLRNMQRMYKYPGVMEAIRAGAWDDVPALLGKSIAGSSMQIVAMAMARRLGVNPNITLGALGVSATGQKSLELKELRESGKIDIDNFSLALNSIMSGGFEVLYEIPTYQMIGAVQKTLKGAGKKSAKQVAKEVTDNALKDIFVKEPGSEMLTEISTMIVDHVTLTEKTDDAGILAKSFGDVVNRVGNAGIAGMGMAAGIRTVGAAGAVGVSALNSIQGKDLTNKIVATYQVVNEDGSLGEVKELTGAEYKEWSKDPNNIAGELNGDIKVNRYNSDIASDVDDIANTNSEDVVQANNDVNEAGKEANSLLNEIENDLQEAPGKKAVGQTEEDKKVPSDKISKVKQLFSRMRNIIQETGAKGIQDLEGLTSKFNSIINKAGLSINDNVTNQNTDNANIQSTETITEIQTEAQAKAVAKALKEGKDPSVVLSQESVGVSKDGKSVSENNITVGKFKSKAAAKKALDNFKKQNSKAAVEERRHAETQKKNNKAFNKVDKKNLDEVSQEEIGGDYNIISASVEGLGEASNEQRNSKLEKVLQKKGLKYKKVQVVENGVSKTAFMVEGMDSAAALDLATGFGQKSITSSKDGILHRDGTVESLDGNVYFGPNARNGAKIVVMNVNGRKVSMRLGTNKPSYSKDFNSKNIEDINSFIEYLPENQKKILGHVLRFFSNIKGLNVRVVKTTSAMKKQLEADGYPADKINSIASNRAFYRGSDGTMVLNLQNMNLNTPFHEIVHPLVDFIKLENPELYSRIEEMVQKSESNIPGSPFKKRWYKNGRRQSGSYMDWAKANYPDKPLSLQVEEAFAEMIGDAAANQFMKDNSKMKQLKDFLAEILEYFNLPTDFLKDKEVADLRLEDIKDIGQLRGDLGAVLARGKTVSVGGVDFNISKPKNTKEVDNSIREQVNNQQHGDDLGVTEVMSLEGVETQEVRFQAGDYTPNFDQNKVKRGSISEFNGQKAMLMCIDRSVSGTVESPSGVVKEFNGGMYYSYQDGTGVWAFSSKSAASKVINKAKESDGLVFLTAMSPQSIDGSVEMFDYVMDEVDNSIKKRKVKRKVALDFINKKLNLKKVQDKLSREGISKKKVKSITEFRELILSLDGAFDVRKDLVSKMISGKDLSSWGIPTREEMYSFVNQGDIKDLTGNPVVAAIRIDTESGFIDSRENTNIKDHPTYSYVVKGEPLMVFDQAVDASELWGDLNLADKYLINPKTGQPYSEGTTAARRNAAVMMATPIVDIRAQAPEVEQVQWQKSKIGRGDLAITNRREEVREAAQNYFDGKINQEEYLEIVQENSPIKPITQFIDPASLEDIKTAVGSKVEGRLDVPIQEGTKVGLRLDIPAYTNKNIWAITVHEDGRGKAMSYTNVARINNVEFISSPKVALGIARGKLSKSTIARMLGEWSPIEGVNAKARGESAKQIVADVMNDPSWSQIGMNPFRHSYFYDRLDGMPVVGADQVVQIGGLVYAKNVQKTTPFDERFEDKRTGLRFQAEDNDGFTGGKNQYGRFNVIPSREYVTARPEDLSLENVAGLSGKGNWAIITGTVEADGGYDADVNVSNNARLYKELVEEFGAENIVITDGVYLNKDQGPSYFISGITESRAMQIGKNFDQEGVLTRRGNIFTDGSGMNPASEKVYVGKEALAQDGSSTTPDGVTFSLDINWKSKVPLSDGIRAQAGENVEFVSNAQVSLSMLSDNNRQPEQWVKEISKGLKGASRDVDTMGLLDLLKAYKKDAKVKSIPKAMVERIIATNMAQVETVILSGETKYTATYDDFDIRIVGDKLRVDFPDGIGFEYSTVSIDSWESYRATDADVIDDALKNYGYDEGLSTYVREEEGPMAPKYPKITLPGGENYREFLIKDKSPDDIFTAPHYDELGENLIASARVDDRVGPNGEKILFVQEIQSDWVQGTNKGDFKTKDQIHELETKRVDLIVKIRKLKEEKSELVATESRKKKIDKSPSFELDFDRLNIEIDSNIDRLQDVESDLKNLIPYLPWNQTDLWVGLTIRKLINQASKEGYDQIAFVNGEQSDIIQGHRDGRTAEFYNKIVPKNINNELKRLVKGMKSDVVNYGEEAIKIVESGMALERMNFIGQQAAVQEEKGLATQAYKSPNAVINLTPELKAATEKVGTMRFQAGGNISEDQMTVLKSTYSDIESKYPDIQINEGMIKMYHYSDNELDVVDPRSAVMNSYSKQEYRTWGRSRVFFYTDPNIKEGVIGGHYKNTTIFPIDRLYPLTEDPLGLNEMAQNNIEVKRNSGDKTQATITLDATTLESADMAISKFRSLTKDMGLNDVIDFGEVTENYKYKRNEDGTTDRAGVESISFTVTYPLGSENINSLVKETFDNSRFEKIDPQTQPINTFEEVAKVAESLGFQGFIYDHVGGKTVSSWHPVEILDDRFQVNDQDQNDVYVSGLGAIMWDLTKPIIDADYALGEWATKVKDKDRPYPIRATQLFAKPKGMHSNAEIKEMVVLSRGKLDEQMFIANKNQKNLKRVVKEEIKRIKAKPEYQQATAQQQEAMLSNLTPEGLNELIGDVNKIKGLMPEQSKLRQAVMQVRDHIDTLSTYLYENGLVSGPMRYTIEGNLGFYLTRAYKKYESSSWRQTDQEVIRRAELFVANQLMSDKGMSKEDAMVRAKQMVDNLIKDKISVTSFKRNTGIGGSMTRVNDIFKERNEDLPKEIRDLLGEINEPFENYVNTISKLSRTVTSHQLYEDLIQMGMGKFIADPNIDDDKTSQVPGIENKLEGKKWGPLEGKFVDNEMFAMLNAYESNALFDSKAYKLWMTFVYGSKKFATVHNPGTHAVNLIGNTFFSIANGHVDPVKFIDAARTAIGEITNLSGKEREAFYQELVSLGVVSSSASLAEIVQIGQDIAAGKDVTSFLDKMNQGKVKKVATIPLRAIRNLDSMATKAYQAEDDVFKIFGFITEKARYMDAGMSEAEATAIAARNTRNTYPNYDMVPSIVRAIGRSPIIGTFVAFQSEAIRCTKNALQLSLQEMGSDKP